QTLRAFEQCRIYLRPVPDDDCIGVSHGLEKAFGVVDERAVVSTSKCSRNESTASESMNSLTTTFFRNAFISRLSSFIDTS
ncbi:hypothetical protein, partial [Paraburkholderia caledonica]|uniref:hypothetical protein n=1 Tax=Paraburkholderia caledonica TaxID=134536 RepID=UPI0015C674E2